MVWGQKHTHIPVGMRMAVTDTTTTMIFLPLVGKKSIAMVSGTGIILSMDVCKPVGSIGTAAGFISEIAMDRT